MTHGKEIIPIFKICKALDYYFDWNVEDVNVLLSLIDLNGVIFTKCCFGWMCGNGQCYVNCNATSN